MLILMSIKVFLDSIENDQNKLRDRYALYKKTGDPLIKRELELDYPFSSNVVQRKRSRKLLKEEFAKFGVQLPPGFLAFIKQVKAAIVDLDNDARRLYEGWLEFRYIEDLESIGVIQNATQNFSKNWLTNVKKGFISYIEELRKNYPHIKGADLDIYRAYVLYRMTGDKKALTTIQGWEK